MSAVEIVMPRLSDAMEQGTIVRWLKDVGDQVDVGDELVEVETDKATVIYEAEVAGLLSAILVQEGEAQQLGGADRAASAAQRRAAPASGRGRTPRRRRRHGARRRPPRDARRAPPRARARRRAERAAGHRPARAHPARRRRGRRRAAGRAAAPAAATRRRRAARAAPPRPAAAARSERLPLTSTQRVIAQRMAETIATVPHFRLSADVDFGEVLRLRKRLRAAVGDAAPTVNDIVVALAGARPARASRGQQLATPATRSSATSASTSASRWRAPARCSCRSCTTPTAARWARSRARRAALIERVRTSVEHARRPGRRHVHRLEPRHVRHQRVRLHHQRARGRDPLGRRRAAARARRRRRRRHARGPTRRSRSRAITARSTAPTAPPFWRACGRSSNPRRSSFCEHDQRSDRGRVPRRRPRRARRGARARRERDPLRRGHRRRRRRLRDDARPGREVRRRRASSTRRSRSSRCRRRLRQRRVAASGP